MRAILISCGLLMTATSIAVAQGWPPLLDYFGRWPRQVVQPTWLTDGAADKDSKSPTPSVQINEKSLQEAAEIRKSIQKAIDDDQFAVDTGSKDKADSPPTRAPTRTLPSWFNGWQWQWPVVSSALPTSQQGFWQRTFRRWQSVFRMPTRTTSG